MVDQANSTRGFKIREVALDRHVIDDLQLAPVRLQN
jgi:hypothetical protein